MTIDDLNAIESRWQKEQGRLPYFRLLDDDLPTLLRFARRALLDSPQTHSGDSHAQGNQGQANVTSDRQSL